MTANPSPSDFANNLNTSLPKHREFIQAALESLIQKDPDALNRDGKLYAIWDRVSPVAIQQLISMEQATAVFGRQPTDKQLIDLNACLQRFSINTPARISHFLAQVAHESGGLQWMMELASGDDYNNRSDLGNTFSGDGPRYKGAGALQLTGRYNYQRFSDFIGDKDVMLGAAYVASQYPFTSAGFWWNANAMNSFIDNGASCRQVSAKVNGRDPANGLESREAYYRKAAGAMKITTTQKTNSSGLDPRGKEEEGLIGPKISAPVKPGDTYLLVNDRDKDMEAYDHNGKALWKIPCLASGQNPNWKKTGGDTPPGLYKIGQIYRDYEKNPNPLQSDTAQSYGWYSFDLIELENQEAANSRAGIMIHGGGSACGWPGAWEPNQDLHPTLGCVRVHNIDARDKILPLCKQGTVYVGVFQQ